MRFRFAIITVSSLFFLTTIIAQNDWISTCGSRNPHVSQIMIDPCSSTPIVENSNEFIILKTGSETFDIRNLRVRIFNTLTNTSAGSNTNYFKIPSTATKDSIAKLNDVYSCSEGIIFLEGAAAPYNGYIPPYSTILAFNNIPKIDELNTASLAAVCGSRVFVVFGVTGSNLFYNNQPVRCPQGCVRTIYIDYSGQSDTTNFCSKYTYDSSLLPRPANSGSNPPAGYGSGSYIRPLPDGKIGYGGGYLNGNNCFPDSALICSPPPIPDYGSGFWNVLGYAGANNYLADRFKGYYEAKENHSVPTGLGGKPMDFQFNSALDGWWDFDAPSNANIAGGARAGWLGCTVPVDTFSIEAKRQGFPCGYYHVKIQWYDYNLRIRIDQKGDGTSIVERNNPDKGQNIWSGYLGDSSKIDILASDDSSNFNAQVIFYRDDTRKPLIDAEKDTITNVACFGNSNGSISTSVNGGATPYRFEWSGPTFVPNTVQNPTNLSAGTYSVIVFDNAGCKDTVNNIVVTQPTHIAVDAGIDIAQCNNTFTMAANTPLSGIGTWSIVSGNASITNANSSTTNITLSSATATLRWTITSGGCTDSDDINLTYNVPITISKQPVNQIVCRGYDATFSVTATGTGLTYQWNKDGTDISGATNSSYTITGATANHIGTYRVKVIGTCTSSVMSSPAVLLFNKKDTIYLPILSRCNPMDTSTQIKLLTNVRGCDSVVIQRFMLSSADTVRRDSLVCTPLSVNEVRYVYRNRFGCDSFEIVNLIRLRNDTTVLTPLLRCEPRDTATQVRRLRNVFGCDSIVVQPYIWASKDTIYVNLKSCNERDTGTVSTVLLNRFGCESLIIRRTQLVPTGIITKVFVQKQLICNGDANAEVNLLTPEGGQPPYSIVWSNGATTEKLQGLKAGKYTISVTDARGCIARDSVVIQEPPPLSIVKSISPPRCYGDINNSFTIQRIDKGAAPYHFQWNNQDTLIDRFPYSVVNIEPDTYPIIVTDRNGCIVKDTIELPKASKREIIFTDEMLDIKFGDSVRLIPELNFTPRSWRWTPVHLVKCDTCLYPVVRPSSSLSFKIMAQDSNGCEVSAYISIKVARQQKVFSPTSFSPNGDGFNDRFTVFTDETVQKVKILEIFDRWGSKIFENRNFSPNDESAGWDGTFKGLNVGSSTYIYYFTIIYQDGKEEFFQGEVSIIR